jgi:hypothetical protein
MIFQKKIRNKLIEKTWDFEQNIIIEQTLEYADKMNKNVFIFCEGPKRDLHEILSGFILYYLHGLMKSSCQQFLVSYTLD